MGMKTVHYLAELDRAEMVAATILLTGGYTWRALEKVPTTGYMVSVAGFEETHHYHKFCGSEVLDYEARNLLGIGRFYGGWLDGDTVYLDVSEHYNSLTAALAAGKRNGQLAIYDLGSGQEIRLDQEAQEAA